MQVFKCALKIIFRNPILLIVYVVGLSFMGVAMASSAIVDDNGVYERVRAQYAVIDRDGSSISHGIEDFLATQGEKVEVEDSSLAMQDAVAKGEVEYLLVIPQGYGESFTKALHDDSELPQMQATYSYSSAAGALVDTALSDYIGLLRTYALLEGASYDISQISKKALEAASEDVPVEVVSSSEDLAASDTYAFYLQFGTYGIFAAIIACAGMLIATLNKPDVRRRNLSSPLGYVAYNTQTALACLVIVFIAWGWTYVLGMICYPWSVAQTAPIGVLLEGVVLFSFALVPLGLAFLVGQLGLSAGAANAIGNIAGLVVSFLGGMWLPFSMMPAEVETVARFLPGYWFTTAIGDAAHVTSASWEQLVPILGSIGMLLLFALVFFLAGLLVGRIRVQTHDAGGNAVATPA